MFKGALKYFAALFKEVGLIGFIMILASFTFLKWGTVKQKEEFIDQFILFKGNTEFPCVIVIVSLIVALSICVTYYRRMISLERDEKRRLSEERTKWQEIALSKKLKSSK